MSEFLAVPRERWIDSLHTHHVSLYQRAPSAEQVRAWADEHAVMHGSLREALLGRDDAGAWGMVFEYELPLEGGRRPDIVILPGGSVIVLEFKGSPRIGMGDLDQARAYARDLAEYHEGSHELPVHALLVSTAWDELAEDHGTIIAVGRNALSRYLCEYALEGPCRWQDWVDASYRPLPALVAAARRIFEREPLPHIKRAESRGIPATVELIQRLIDAAQRAGERSLVLVTGVPGAGKTLVGLRVVYESSRDDRQRGLFLSGNGPLITVLRDALRSWAFVKDVHRVVRDFARTGRKPRQQLIVIDEAQRLWDRDQMRSVCHIDASEPDLFVRLGEQVGQWCALVGLIGEGQVIYSGEEGGLDLWKQAVEGEACSDAWHVHAPPRLEEQFAPLAVESHPELDLTVSLRSRRAEELHRWVDLLLQGSLGLAHRVAVNLHRCGFPVYLSRTLDEAKRYVRVRYHGEPEKQFGMLRSSHDKTKNGNGVPKSLIARQQKEIAAWFNAPCDSPESCCSFGWAASEFICQGLELDMPIVCWGDDGGWMGTHWEWRPTRRRRPVRDPQQVLRNSYRVLLTRGRDGLVIYLPSSPDFDLTEQALLAAGVQLLPEEATLAQAVADH